MIDLAVVVLHHRNAAQTEGALRSLVPRHEAEAVPVVVVDNASEDGSAEALQALARDEGWSWMRLVRSPVNGGFASGMNQGMACVEARSWLLLNSDARLLPDTLAALRRSRAAHPEAGLIGVQLVGADGEERQPSAFRDCTPLGELVRAAGLSSLDRLLARHVVALPLSSAPRPVDWVSFACVLVSAEARAAAGPLDEGFFMYFEDIDYARRVRAAGLAVVQDPGVRAVHLRGGSSSVKSAVSRRERVPRYYYVSRTRYFAKHFGRPGLVAANLCWLVGRACSWVAERLTGREVHACRREGIDIWIRAWRPLAAPEPPASDAL